MTTIPARGSRPALALALYLLAVFAGGALLAPWLFHAVQALAPGWPALERIAGMPFGRYVNRALLIVALVGLPFFVRGSGIRRWRDVGVPRGVVGGTLPPRSAKLAWRSNSSGSLRERPTSSRAEIYCCCRCSCSCRCVRDSRPQGRDAGSGRTQ
jgi:hypothetical protein